MKEYLTLADCACVYLWACVARVTSLFQYEDVRMKAFNDPLNNLIQHKELKSSREN